MTRVSAPRDGLIRFVVAPDRTLTPDLAETLPGRGIWATASRAVLTGKSFAKSVARAARGPVTIDPALADRTEALLVARCQSLIGLARRSGAVETGFEKVRTAILSGRSSLMLTARDSIGRDARELARRADGLEREIRRTVSLTAAEMGSALGRERQVHVAVADGPLADRLFRDLSRLAGMRGAGGRDAPGPAPTEIEETASGEAGETARKAARGR